MDSKVLCLDHGMPVSLGWCREKLAGEVLRTALTGFLEAACNQLSPPVEGEDWSPTGVAAVEREV